MERPIAFLHKKPAATRMFFTSPLVAGGLLAVILFGLFVSPSLAEAPNAQVETRIPNRGAVEVPNGDILDFLKLQDRLDGVALRVANAAEGRCANRWRYPGFKTHKVTDYPRRMRRGAKSFAEKTPTVLATTSAHLRGQILPGDQIVDAQGRPLDDDSQALQIELALGRVNLSRAGEELTVTGTWPQLCYRPVHLTASQTVKASTTPNGVEVSKGLVEYVRSDDELAYAIAHELSHFMLDHSRRLAKARSEGRLSPSLRRNLEIDADRGAVFLMHRAGYDVRGALAFIDRSSVLRDFPLLGLSSHPRRSDRLSVVETAIEDIFRSQGSTQSVADFVGQ